LLYRPPTVANSYRMLGATAPDRGAAHAPATKNAGPPAQEDVTPATLAEEPSIRVPPGRQAMLEIWTVGI